MTIPRWIKNSDLYKQYNDVYEDEKFVIADERLFEFPKELSDDNIRKVLDNVRYLGVDDEEILYKCFCFLVVSKCSLRNNFPELDYLFKTEYVDSPEKSVRTKNLFSLRYAYEHGCEINEETCRYAAWYGSLPCLEFLHKKKCKWNHKTCIFAARKGHLECLKYAHENGCPLDENLCFEASKYGHLNCLKYAYENGCKFSPGSYETYSSRAAAGYGHLDCLMYIFENDEERDNYVCENAAANGFLDCFKYAHENGCEYSTDAAIFSAEHGHLECLKYAIDNNDSRWDGNDVPLTCYRAASNGHLECLILARTSGFHWDEQVFNVAAAYGHLNCVKYLYENKCRYDEDVYSYSVDNIELFKYFYSIGLLDMKNICEYVNDNGNKECLNFCIEQKCDNFEEFEEQENEISLKHISV